MKSLPARRRSRSLSGLELMPFLDPLELELAQCHDPARDDDYLGDEVVPPPTSEIERLVDERVQLSADLCQILWRHHDVEAAIRREAARCTSSEDSRAEILRHCYARARARLRAERRERR